MKVEKIDRLLPDEAGSFQKLGEAYFAGGVTAQPFYAFEQAGFEEAARELRKTHRTDRRELVHVLREFNLSLGAAPEAISAIDRLGHPETVAVVSGQQTAPLTGPFLTILKALTTVALCRRLKDRHGLEAVPVFWAEGDDHDHEEISSIALGYEEEQLKTVSFNWPEELRGAPIGDLPLSEKNLRRELIGILSDTEFQPHVLDLVFPEKKFFPEVGLSFAALMIRLMSPLGLVVAYSRHEPLRQLWRQFIPGVLERSADLTGEVMKSADRIKEAGFKAQVHRKAESAPFFVIEEGRRRPVTIDGENFLVDGHGIEREKLQERLLARPMDFSPGVTLRAVLQDNLLPTVAYAAGPSEASYFGQLMNVYGLMDTTMPVIVPRFSATFVEPGPQRVLDRHSLAPSRFFLETADSIFSSLVSSGNDLIDPKRWEAIRSASLSPLEEYAKTLPGEFTPLINSLKKTVGQIAHILQKAETKTGQAIRSREKETGRQIRRCHFQLLPEGVPMERRLNIFYFINKYGPGLIGALAESVPEDTRGHYFLGLGSF